MKPVLFSILGQPISSFGLFILLSALSATFVIWRIVKVYELDDEKVLDLILLTFIGGLILSRCFFVMINPSSFDDFAKVILINKYPGLSFWGGFLGSIITLSLFSKKLRLNFWQMADFMMVGFFLAIAISSLGCLLGSCQYGLISENFFALSFVGVIGKRFPLQIVESFIFFLVFLYLWQRVLKFHFYGQIATLGLIILGLFKLMLEFYRGDKTVLFGAFSLGMIGSVVTIVLGTVYYYRISKKSVVADLRFILSLFSNLESQRLVVSKLKRSWYNLRVNFRVGARKSLKALIRLLRIRAYRV